MVPVFTNHTSIHIGRKERKLRPVCPCIPCLCSKHPRLNPVNFLRLNQRILSAIQIQAFKQF